MCVGMARRLGASEILCFKIGRSLVLCIRCGPSDMPNHNGKLIDFEANPRSGLCSRLMPEHNRSQRMVLYRAKCSFPSDEGSIGLSEVTLVLTQLPQRNLASKIPLLLEVSTVLSSNVSRPYYSSPL